MLQWIDLPAQLLAQESQGKRLLWITDKRQPRAATLPDGLTVAEALADFAASYQGPASHVRWQLWECGCIVEADLYPLPRKFSWRSLFRSLSP